MDTGTFVYVIYSATTVQKVWKALLDGELTRQYWKHEYVTDWTINAKWKLVADDGPRTVKHVGQVLDMVPEKRLVLSWGESVESAHTTDLSRLAIDIEPAGQMVRVTVTHDQLNPDMQRRISGGWPLVMSSLKSFLETGHPLEILACKPN